MDRRASFAAAAVAMLMCLAIEADSTEADLTYIVIGSTTFTLTERVQKCLETLGLSNSNSTNPGGYLRKCLRKLSTTTRAPNETYFINAARETLVAEEGSTAVLRCEIVNLGRKRVFWWRGQTTLLSSMYTLYADDRRVKIEAFNSTFNIRITRVRKSDAGKYKCQVLARRFKLERIVELEVPSLPSIVSLEPTTPPFFDQSDRDRRYFNRTTDAILYCNASGFPDPTVTWEKVGYYPPMGGSPQVWGDTVLLSNIDEQDAGVYNCTASNGVGTIERSIEVVVQYLPVVRSPATSIRAGRGQYVSLDCEVSAVPSAEIMWRRDNVTIQTAGQGLVRDGKQYTTYILVSVDPDEDYGVYRCTASNMMGASFVSIELHGRPLPPRVTSAPKSTRRHAYSLSWQPGMPPDEWRPQEILVSSYVIQFRGWWIQKTGALQRVVYTHQNPLREVIPAVDRQQEYNYVIRDLRPNTTYQMTIYGRNQYGKGEPTAFTFYTANENAPSAPKLATANGRATYEQKVTPRGLQSGAAATLKPSAGLVDLVVFAAVVVGKTSS
ncbi:neurotrimin-like [Acanthaster planci]|uniref:Neurotrimin-like n=1 Tax=Acanthaster planci TaxID=133434 RepID=A0A8B7Z6V2_ACAPL|nr:neurotrimin-like [Acanthaster planci]